MSKIGFHGNIKTTTSNFRQVNWRKSPEVLGNLLNYEKNAFKFKVVADRIRPHYAQPRQLKCTMAGLIMFLNLEFLLHKCMFINQKPLNVTYRLFEKTI